MLEPPGLLQTPGGFDTKAGGDFIKVVVGLIAYVRVRVGVVDDKVEFTSAEFRLAVARHLASLGSISVGSINEASFNASRDAPPLLLGEVAGRGEGEVVTVCLKVLVHFVLYTCNKLLLGVVRGLVVA